MGNIKPIVTTLLYAIVSLSLQLWCDMAKVLIHLVYLIEPKFYTGMEDRVYHDYLNRGK